MHKEHRVTGVELLPQSAAARRWRGAWGTLAVAAGLFVATACDQGRSEPGPQREGRAPGSVSIRRSAVFEGNGIAIPNGLNLPNGMNLGNGMSLGNGLNLGNGINTNGINTNGMVLGNGINLGNGIVFGNGINTNGINTNGINLGNGIYLGNGINTNGINTNGINTNGINTNGINTNGINTNGINTNGISLGNGVTLGNSVTVTNLYGSFTVQGPYIAPDQGSDLEKWLDVDPVMNQRVLRYLVECAIPRDVPVTFRYKNEPVQVFHGKLGLGVNLMNADLQGQLSEPEQEAVSSCMLARVNARGEVVTINMFGTSGDLALPPTQAELDEYSHEEATFFGNLFQPPVDGQPQAAAYVTMTYGGPNATVRFCNADGMPTYDVPGDPEFSVRCGPALVLSAGTAAGCSYAHFLDVSPVPGDSMHGFATRCQLLGKTWSYPISVRLRPLPDGAACYDANGRVCASNRCNSDPGMWTCEPTRRIYLKGASSGRYLRPGVSTGEDVRIPLYVTSEQPYPTLIQGLAGDPLVSGTPRTWTVADGVFEMSVHDGSFVDDNVPYGALYRGYAGSGSSCSSWKLIKVKASPQDDDIIRSADQVRMMCSSMGAYLHDDGPVSQTFSTTAEASAGEVFSIYLDTPPAPPPAPAILGNSEVETGEGWPEGGQADGGRFEAPADAVYRRFSVYLASVTASKLVVGVYLEDPTRWRGGGEFLMSGAVLQSPRPGWNTVTLERPFTVRRGDIVLLAVLNPVSGNGSVSYRARYHPDGMFRPTSPCWGLNDNHLGDTLPAQASCSGIPDDWDRYSMYLDNPSCGDSFCDPGEDCSCPGDCAASLCAAQGATCDSITVCGGAVACGTCDTGLTCQNHQCVCLPTSCAELGAFCGAIPDGCGGQLDCGQCLNEAESNTATSSANQLTINPTVVTGRISTKTDLDFFKLTLPASATLALGLVVPAGKNYDLYLYDSNGTTLLRSSTSTTAGAAESITYANGAASRLVYIKVMGASQACSTSLSYQLRVRW